MYRKATPLFLVCQTPLHAGSGSDLGIVDLPIQRERHTSFPKIESSSLKGAIREAFERAGLDELNIHKCFGFDKDSASDTVKTAIPERQREYAGALGFTDARLLLFPVKSMKGVFAWITCPKALKQLAEDMGLAEQGNETLVNASRLAPEPHQCFVTASSSLVLNTKKDGKEKTTIVLEEYAFASSVSPALTVLATWLSENILRGTDQVWGEKLAKDVVILTNDDFKDFVNLSTEVITRTKIDNATGTVETGALFTEEYLPAESVMYSLALTAAEFREHGMLEETVRGFLTEIPAVVQIGGNASLGKGIVSTKLLN